MGSEWRLEGLTDSGMQLMLLEHMHIVGMLLLHHLLGDVVQ
jgi:hypothetical protein